jgi:protocatechuate 3,4-dioxygenase beta subunit
MMMMKKMYLIYRRDVLKGMATCSIVGCTRKPPLEQQSTDPVKEVKTPPSNLCQSTVKDIEGPFYLPNAPIRNQLNVFDDKGTLVRMSGRVFISDCNRGMAHVFVDVWHADPAGGYDNESEAMKYRCRIKTDEEGRYELTTLLPGRYKNGRTYRPRHFHIKIFDSDNVERLTTQMYFKGDPYIESDPFVHISNVVSFEGSEDTQLEAKDVDFTIS